MSSERAAELRRQLDRVTLTLTGGNDPDDPGSERAAIHELIEVVDEILSELGRE